MVTHTRKIRKKRIAKVLVTRRLGTIVIAGSFPRCGKMPI